MKSEQQEINGQKKVEVEGSKTLAVPLSPEKMLESLGRCKTNFDPELVLREANQEITGKSVGQEALNSTGSLYKALTLAEFDRGILLGAAIPERYRTFAVDFSKNMQAEFGCRTPSERATAELAALNYVRSIEIQNRINGYLAKDAIGEIGVKFLAVLSKELDRANRHYLAAVQVLRSMNQPPLNVSVRTQTAVFGQNQMVQTNNRQ